MEFQDHPADPKDYLPPEEPDDMSIRQWTAMDFDGDELLVTLYANGTLEVARRIDRSRWGPPFEVEEITE